MPSYSAEAHELDDAVECGEHFTEEHLYVLERTGQFLYELTVLDVLEPLNIFQSAQDEWAYELDDTVWAEFIGNTATIITSEIRDGHLRIDFYSEADAVGLIVHQRGARPGIIVTSDLVIDLKDNSAEVRVNTPDLEAYAHLLNHSSQERATPSRQAIGLTLESLEELELEDIQGDLEHTIRASLHQDRSDVPSPEASPTSTRFVLGTLVHWNSQEWRSDLPGSRIAACDSGLGTYCHPADHGCCYDRLPRVKVTLHPVLWGITGPTPLATTYTSNTGAFGLEDSSGWAYDYVIRVTFERPKLSYFPAMHMAHSATPNDPLTWDSQIFMPGGTSVDYLGIVHMSAPGHSSLSLIQNRLAIAWSEIVRLLQALSSDGFQPYQTATTPIKFLIDPDSNDASCSTSRIRVTNGRLTMTTPAHELGHLIHARMLGCGNEWFPPKVGNQWHWAVSESANAEAIADLFRYAAFLNLDTTPWFPTMLRFLPDADGIHCINSLVGQCSHLALLANLTRVCGHITGAGNDVYEMDNLNFLASQRNIFLTYWDLLDSDDEYTRPGTSDPTDLTWVEFFDAMLEWKNAPLGGYNGAPDEVLWVNSGTTCSVADDCANGEVCSGGQCYHGDVHGNNVRDFVRYLPSIGVSEADGWRTMQSGLCLGGVDNSWPFTGGYRSD